MSYDVNRDFMEMVLPWPGDTDPGYVGFHWFPPPKKDTPDKRPPLMGSPVRSLDRFMELTHKAAANDRWYRDCYFGLALQARTKYLARRNLHIADRSCPILLKAIWADIDVKDDPEHYSTKGDAIDAVKAMCEAEGFPFPSAWIDSGGGVHVYWISDTPFEVDVWRRYANLLRYFLEKNKVKADIGLTTDANRVLRVPGTWNNKQSEPRPCRIVGTLGAPFSFSRLDGFIGSLPSQAVSAPSKTIRASGQTEHLFVTPGSFSHTRPLKWSFLPEAKPLLVFERRPLNALPMFQKCLHYRHQIKTGGAKTEQGLWMQTVLGLSFVRGGRELSHEVSKGYSTYTKEETDGMFDRKSAEAASLGWPSCKAFENFGASDQCNQCPFKGKVKSPLNLAEEWVPAPIPTEPEEVTREKLRLPGQYFIDKDMHICSHIALKTNTGDVEDEPIKIFHTPIFSVAQMRSPLGFLFNVGADLKRRRQVVIPYSVCHNPASLANEFARAEIICNAKAFHLLVELMTTWMERLRREEAALDSVSYGWVADAAETDNHGKVGFAYDGRIHYTDGHSIQTITRDPQLAKIYCVEGKPDVWWKLHRLITDQQSWHQEMLMATAFAGPLMTEAGQANGTLVCWSPHGGTYKTTAIRAAVGVWASPTAGKGGAGSSGKGMIARMGRLKNIPFYWDEVNEDAHVEAVRSHIQTAGEGSPSVLLKPTREFYEAETWQSLVCVGTNTSFVSASTAAIKGTNAQLLRIFEVQAPDAVPSSHGREITHLVADLDINHGHVGLEYAKLLARHIPTLRADIDGTQADFIERLGSDYQSAERYWLALCVAIIQGAKYANQLGCSFHVEELTDYMVQQYKLQREAMRSTVAVGGTRAHAERLLGEWLAYDLNHTLWSWDRALGTGRGKFISVLKGPPLDGARKEPTETHFVLLERKLYISINKLRQWVTYVKKENYGVFERGLRQHFFATSDRMTLGARSSWSGTQEPVLIFDVPDVEQNFLYEPMWKFAPGEQRPIRLDQSSSLERPVETGLAQPAQSPDQSASDPQPEHASTAYRKAVELEQGVRDALAAPKS